MKVMSVAAALLVVGSVLGIGSTPVFAEEAVRALPTLLIKGEVVSRDTSDPAAALVKVRDRYGFETPIFLTPETKILQDGQTVGSDRLTEGTAVEVEYNFDVNTAKRHAVSVKLPGVKPAEAAAAPVAAPAAPAPEAPAATPAPVEPAQPADAPAVPGATDVPPASEPAPAAAVEPAPAGTSSPATQ